MADLPTTDFDTVDYFTDQSLVPDPHPYFDHLRSKCPVAAQPAADAVRLKESEDFMWRLADGTAQPPTRDPAHPTTKEFLRYTFLADVEVEGTRFKEGERFWISWAMANRDPSVFDEPNRIVLDRKGNRHFSFGIGVHRCVGSNVARTVFTSMLTAVLDRMPDYMCHPEGAVHYDSIGVIQGMRNLPATFTPGKRLGPGLDETLEKLQRICNEQELAGPIAERKEAAIIDWSEFTPVTGRHPASIVLLTSIEVTFTGRLSTLAATPAEQDGGTGDMIKLSRAKLAIAVGALAVTIPASAGVAAAAPFDAVVNTTCTYDQIIAALNAQRPDLAQEFNASAFAQGALRSFLASPPAQRQQTVTQLQGSPAAAEYFGPITSIAGSCNNY